MKKLFSLLFALLLGVTFTLAQCEYKKVENKACCKGKPVTAQNDSRFEMLQRLEGEWIQEGEDKVSLAYRVSSGGSTIVETLFGGTEYEMITMYHKNGDDLVMTHYCSEGNQPTMKAEKRFHDKSLAFQCSHVSNVETHDERHMHALNLTFLDDDHLSHEWILSKDGKTENVVNLKFARKKD